MWDELRDRIAVLLATCAVGVLCAAGADGPSGAAVRYRSQGLELDCLLPRWADVTFSLEDRPQALLLIQLEAGLWLRYQGLAYPAVAPDWDRLPQDAIPSELYVVVRLRPVRIDLLDEAAGWGVRETLELS